jgi:AraC family transcriptional regulator
LRVPPMRDLSPVIARAAAALAGTPAISWEELGLELAARTVRLDRGLPRESSVATPAAIARVARVVRSIDDNPDGESDLTALARAARLSPYHFLRTFRGVTGVTPHRYLLRRRLERAAVRLKNEPFKILDIALDCGFGDLSNFNRAFRAEFGLSPRAWRRSGNR